MDANASAASNNAATVAAAFYAAGETITIFADRLVNWGGCVTVFCRVGRRIREPTPARRRLEQFCQARALDEPQRGPSVVGGPQPGVPCLSGPQSLNVGSSSS